MGVRLARNMTSALRIQEMASPERPRERLIERGPRALNTSELLAILLRTGTTGASAVEVGHQLLRRFGSLEAVARAPLDQLVTVRGVGPDKAALLKAAFELAVRLTEEKRRATPLLDTPGSVATMLREELSLLETERFLVLLLDTRRHLIRIEEVGRGLLDSVLVHPREVFRPALVGSAHSIVVAHNHPSGDPTPSEADIRTTRDLIRAGQLLRVELLDHIIIGRPSADRPRDFCSLKELGQFYS
ncbi:MAG: DNA repair protein RadC [Verrucomicrobia bacterium]|nr:DNA repair protein RadC [Verrucomicrobiota bacterium]